MEELSAPSAVVAEPPPLQPADPDEGGAGAAMPDSAPQVTLTTSDGVAFSLTADLSAERAGIALLAGATGLDAPPWQATVNEYAGIDGGHLGKTRAATRKLSLPLLLWAPSRPELLSLKRRFVSSVMRGPCVVRVAEADGSARALTVHYTGGLEGDEAAETSGLTHTRYGLHVTALDPYWYGPWRSVRFRVSGGRPHFLSRVDGQGDEAGFLPLCIAPSVINDAGLDVEVESDVETWPVWRITGPLGHQDVGQPTVPVRLSNLTTGAALTLDRAVPAGTTVVIDTRPGICAVYAETPSGGRGENWWPHIESNAALWPLPPGVNRIAVSAAGADDRSSVALTYQTRHWGA